MFIKYVYKHMFLKNLKKLTYNRNIMLPRLEIPSNKGLVPDFDIPSFDMNKIMMSGNLPMNTNNNMLSDFIENNMYIIEYVWLGGKNELRSKTRVIEKKIESVDDIPDWNYDGSSTGQAEGHDSEVIIKPRVIFANPLRKNNSMSNNIIVMCDTWKPNLVTEPHETNTRFPAFNLFQKKKDEEPWFGIEQEYFLKDKNTGLPLGVRKGDIKDGVVQYVAPPQGQYYCSNGTGNAFGRNVVEEHLQACIEAGIKISGINAEVAPGQWEYQIGPCVGIDSGDQVWISRYLLICIAEKHDLIVDFHPKPMKGDWNGSGCHTNYSTKNMREGTKDKTGLEYIEEAMVKLEEKHDEHMLVYGEDNDKRMTGAHETASYDKFTYGRANRGASVRIGNETIKDGKGYFEDRRPASNMDPYAVTSIIFKTTVL